MLNLQFINPGQHFDRNIFLRKKENTFFFFILWAKQGRKMAKFLAVFYKLHFTWPHEFFWKLFLRFEYLFYLFRSFGKNNLERLSKLLSMSAEDRFERRRIIFRKNIFHVFGIWINYFLDSWQKHLGRLAELPLEEPRWTFWEQCFFLKKNSSFADFETKTFGKKQKFLAAFSKLHNTWREKHI